ncbi:MAG: YfhO family protein [Bacteroidales bacterium]|jgi:hypothetical protein|nr:YfhO family protein [Bacteroidales bacterium]
MEKKNNFKNYLPHIAAIAIFLLLSIVYFAPVVFDGKDLVQGDVTSVRGWGKDLKDYHNETGEYAFWSNSMFSGMPANYTYMPPTTNIFKQLGSIFKMGLSGLHLGVIFIYMLGFYIFLIAIGCKTWLSIVGAVAYALGSYNFIIIEAGHVNKGLVMATMAPVMGGIILCYRKKYLWGILITLIFTGINVMWSHQQVTYYLILMIGIIAVIYLIYAIKDKTLKDYLKSSAILVVTALIAVLPSLGSLIPTMDYTKETMRGGAVLQNNPNGETESSGLDVDYAFQWSYGKAETMTLLIPNFQGGASKPFDKGSESYQELMGNYRSGRISDQELNEYYRYTMQYWGDQPFTSGPVYAGAIVCLLFILGLFVVKGPEKWWLLAATILSILLSWGRNFPAFNEFLFHHLPLYNKFRTPSMALVMAGVTMATMAVLALKEIIDHRNDADFQKKYLNPLYISTGITGGLCLIFALFGGTLLSFSTPDNEMLPEWLSSALRHDRKQLITSDAWRSLAFIALAFAAIWAFIKYKIKAGYLLAAIGVLILVDLWVVDKRYVSDSSFVPKKKAQAIIPTEADKYILQDTDPDYRVMNLTTSTFNESQTSYSHKSIGGYSPAKLRRYQDIIDYHFAKGLNMNVLNMLNARYFIVPTQQGPMPQRNPDAMGNSWFVDTIKWVNSPDEEIVALHNFNPHTTAFIDVAWKDKYDYSTLATERDSAGYIRLADYKNPGNLIYESSSSLPKLAVFSEVFYKTWKVYIDGQEVPLIRANYILRALPVPAGNHTIEFQCVDEVYDKASAISLWGSILVGLILAGLLFLLYRENRKEKAQKQVD